MFTTGRIVEKNMKGLKFTIIFFIVIRMIRRNLWYILQIHVSCDCLICCIDLLYVKIWMLLMSSLHIITIKHEKIILKKLNIIVAESYFTCKTECELFIAHDLSFDCWYYLDKILVQHECIQVCLKSVLLCYKIQ